MESEALELSSQEAFSLAMIDETFHDVTLLGSDGVQVPANRTILGLRSTVFRKMLFGKFQEASTAIVHVNYPGKVITALVEYIHNYTAKILVNYEATNDKGGELSDDRQEEFHTLLELVAAASYYGFPKLCHDAQKCLSSYLEAFPLLAFVLVEYCCQEGQAIAEDLQLEAISHIQTSLQDSDAAKFLAISSQAAVEFILVQPGNADMSEQCRFVFIDQWCRASSKDQDRRSVAEKLVTDHVDLKSIDPDYLSDSVEASGLVTFQDLYDAYKGQAHRAKHEFGAAYLKKRNRSKCLSPNWKRSGSSTSGRTLKAQSDTLDFPKLVAGTRYRWNMSIRGNRVWSGVAMSTALDNFSTSYQKYAARVVGCFGYHLGDGGLYCNGEKVSSFRNSDAIIPEEGGDVTMFLDLSSIIGTLSISVNGKSTITIASELNYHLRQGCPPMGNSPSVSMHESAMGFVPIVSYQGAETQVTILSIEEF